MNLKIFDIHWLQARIIIRECRLIRPSTVFFLILYFCLTVFDALLDGFSVVLLINLITGKMNLSDPSPIMVFMKWIHEQLGLAGGAKSSLLIVAGFFTTRVLLSFIVGAIDGQITPYLRRKIQEEGFRSLLLGDWEFLREIRVGQRVGALTEEAVIATKYLYSFIRSFYFFISCLVLGMIALLISSELTLVFLIAGIPSLILLQALFFIQAKTSSRQMVARQGFAADITERLSGLFQIKVEGQSERHIHDGLGPQKQMTRLEIHLGYYQAAISSFQIAFPAIALITFYFWTSHRGNSLTETMPLLAGVGVIGARAMGQLNGLIASWGNLSRLSGSILPVRQLFSIPRAPSKEAVGERLQRVEVHNVSYRYNGNRAVEGIAFSVEKGQPLIIFGASGSGKTTIANLMAGIYRPDSGQVTYVGASGRCYDAREFKTHIGYVTQDIYLFHGTVRKNLLPNGKESSDEVLWSCLEQVGAADFVRAMGGLDAKIVESGKSLSGGEKRRLGIARVLMGQPDLIIFDEITTGLDEKNRQIIQEAVMKVARSAIVTIITHEENFRNLGKILILS